MDSIYQYSNYRKYLKDYYLDRKRSSAGFNLTRFSAMAGLKSCSHIKMVIDGSRDLTVSCIHTLGLAMDLNRDELQYFEALVLCEVCKEAHGKSYYQSRLNELKRRKPTRGLRTSEYVVASKWYYPALLISLDGQKVEGALEAMSERLNLNTSEISRSISEMLNHGWLTIADSFYRVQFAQLSIQDSEQRSLLTKKFLREQIERSLLAFERDYHRGAKFFSDTFTIRSQDFDEYAKRITSFSEDLIAHSDRIGAADCLVQLNNQFFRLTKFK